MVDERDGAIRELEAERDGEIEVAGPDHPLGVHEGHRFSTDCDDVIVVSQRSDEWRSLARSAR